MLVLRYTSHTAWLPFLRTILNIKIFFPLMQVLISVLCDSSSFPPLEKRLS